ncbi:MAG TPA: hypothetical protein VHA06_06305, partial [Candidatus Angelobacter sp.]|nr:hypothetical protein [Candidatus Angelobacter sp.]
MNTELTDILAGDGTIGSIGALLDSKDQANETLTQTNQGLTDSNGQLQQQHLSDVATMQQLSDQHTADELSMQQLEDKLNAALNQLAGIAGTVVYASLENTPWLVAGGTAANSNQTGSTAVATQGQTTTTSAFLKEAPAGPYADSYFFKKFAVDPSKTKYRYDLLFMFGTAADAAASQCIELDIQQCISGKVFNVGLQIDFADNAIRVWNRSSATPANTGGGNWVAIPGLTCPRWTAGQWMHVVFEAHRDANQIYVDAVTINGVRTVVNMTFLSPVLG